MVPFLDGVTSNKVSSLFIKQEDGELTLKLLVPFHPVLGYDPDRAVRNYITLRVTLATAIS